MPHDVRAVPPARSVAGRLLPIALAVLAVAVAVLVPRTARADATPLHVLLIESNGPDDQADALTTALRAKFASFPAQWQILESPQSFETIRLAKCPPPKNPDPTCLGIVSQFLKGTPFVWGTLKVARPGQLVAEVHMFRPDRGDSAPAMDMFSENLKDDIKKVAARLYAKLTGTQAGALVGVHAATQAGGAVLVDGVVVGQLDAQGNAKVDVPSGPHTIELRVPGFQPAARTIGVSVGEDQDLGPFTLTPARVDTPGGPQVTRGGVPWRKVTGFTLLGLGVVSGIIGGVEGIRFLSLKSDLDSSRSQVPASVTDVCADRSTQPAIDACNTYKDAKNARVLELVFLGVGAALAAGGIVLIVTDHSGDGDRATARAKPQLLPRLGPHGGGLDFSMTW